MYKRQEFPTAVAWADGPGNAQNTAANYVVDDRITWVCVESASDQDSGNLVLWRVEQDNNGDWQWHSD